jgi:hypothetical protein
MEKIQGEQFTLEVSFEETTYTGCSQMLALLYEENTGKHALRFVKVADPVKYAEAEIILPTADDKVIALLFKTAKTATLLGKYKMELKLTYTGNDTPIVKAITETIEFNATRTND